MRQNQTEQQTKTQHAAAIHKPLHDDSTLFVIKLKVGCAYLLLRHDKLVLQLLVFFFQPVDHAVALRYFLLHIGGTLKGFLLLLMVIMLAIPLLAQSQVGAAISMVVWGAATFAVVPPLQMRVMRVAHEAPGLSSSVNIGAFNLGNALGAAAGGAVSRPML